MKTLYLLKKLAQLPLFTENDISKIINKGPKYVKNLLCRLNKGELIKRIERGKYTVHDDAMVFASYVVWPSYLSLWTALKYYNMTQQQPLALFILSPTARKNIKFGNTELIFAKNKHMFGYKKERYSDFDIFIADREKAIIDSILFKLPIQDINEALDDTEINFQKLADYAKKTENISLMKRIGYLIGTKKGENYGLKAEDSNYIILDYLGKKKGKKDKKWKVIVNL